MSIETFGGEFCWLSNFYPAPVMLDGKQFPSVENAYQAAKTTSKFRGPFQDCTPEKAKRMGRQVLLRWDWDEIKIDLMRDLLAQKFAKGTELGNKLEATSGELVEGNNWGDTFWGVCNGVGANWLGRLLMDRRTSLLTSNKETAENKDNGALNGYNG